MDLRKLSLSDLTKAATWKRGWYSLRTQFKESPEAVAGTEIEELYFPRHDVPPRPRQLRILFIAPRYDYGNPKRGLGVEENYFLHALVAMGHQLVRFDSLALRKRVGKEKMNRMLREAVNRYDPDAVFSIMFGDELDPDTVSSVTKEQTGRTVNWFCDDQWRFDRYSSRWAPNFGWVVTTSEAAVPRYRALGSTNVILSQWGCNHFLYRPIRGQRLFDVSFIGQPHGDRPAVIAQLRRAGIDVSVWGYGWPAGKVTQAQMISIFSLSRINLNLSNASVGQVDQVKGRDFEVPGCRGFLLSKRSPELARCFTEGREIEMYGDVDELIDKIRHYLRDEDAREQIARAGYERTLREHTMEMRLTSVLEKVASAD